MALTKSASAQSGDQKTCENNAAPPDAIINACARWMQTGRLTAFGKSVAYQNRAFALQRKGNIDEAIVEMTKSISANSSAGGFYNRGNMWASRNEYDRAISDYTRAIDKEPTWVRYFI